MKPIVNGTFDLAKNKTMLSEAKRNLIIITFDLEDDYSEVAKESEYESGQSYRKQVLCPNNDRFIDTWMVAGLSLGAHAAWLAMDRDPRLSLCIPIVG
ncbi:alpha/beta hydrolase family containing protein, putative, partial [Rhizoctonia solani AG-3 Rhs1AP]